MGKYTRPIESETIKRIITKVSEINNVSYKTVENILLTEFQFVKSVIEEGEFKTISLPSFGKFTAKPYRLKKLTETYKELTGNDFVPFKKEIKELTNVKNKYNNRSLEKCNLEKPEN